jgi:hypothetical protein
MEPANDHGDPRNLVKARFVAAGKTSRAGGKSFQQVVRTVVKTAKLRK